MRRPKGDLSKKLCDCGQPAMRWSGTSPECTGCHYRNLLYRTWSSKDFKRSSAALMQFRLHFRNLTFPPLRPHF